MASLRWVERVCMLPEVLPRTDGSGVIGRWCGWRPGVPEASRQEQARLAGTSATMGRMIEAGEMPVDWRGGRWLAAEQVPRPWPAPVVDTRRA